MITFIHHPTLPRMINHMMKNPIMIILIKCVRLNLNLFNRQERDAKSFLGYRDAPTVTALLRTWLWLGQISPPLTRMEAALPGLQPHQWMANVFLH